jgi:hypothetical protein
MLFLVCDGATKVEQPSRKGFLRHGFLNDKYPAANPSSQNLQILTPSYGARK